MSQRRAQPLSSGQVGGDDGQFVLVEWHDPGGVSGPDRPIAGLHVHHEDDEAWYVLEGALAFRVGDDVVQAPAGSAVFVKGGTPHAYWNATDGPARYVLVMTPRIRRLVDALHQPGVSDHAAVFRAHASELL